MEKQLKDYAKEEFAASKDEINSLLTEQACEAGFKRLRMKHPRKKLIELDPDGDGESTRYKEKFQDEFDGYYDEEYNRLSAEIGFDVYAENGIKSVL